ncbi:hypothetical protein [Nocardia anaemiae]|uniref:hypothetical protein n=1 Tax=Nocardia anaemiae TaxID=263910 RepID=UPI000ABC6CEC|nr:hypothetical protein [Nocardia anaemiae]
MSYSPPPEPTNPTWHPGAATPGRNTGYSAPMPPQGPNPPQQQQFWVHTSDPRWQLGPQADDRRQGPWFAIGSVILGLIGCVLPFLPMIDLTGVRPLIGLPFAIPGLVVGIVGCTGPRRAKGLAVIGIILSVLALTAECIMLPQLF